MSSVVRVSTRSSLRDDKPVYPARSLLLTSLPHGPRSFAAGSLDQLHGSQACSISSLVVVYPIGRREQTPRRDISQGRGNADNGRPESDGCHSVHSVAYADGWQRMALHGESSADDAQLRIEGGKYRVARLPAARGRGAVCDCHTMVNKLERACTILLLGSNGHPNLMEPVHILATIQPAHRLWPRSQTKRSLSWSSSLPFLAVNVWPVGVLMASNRPSSWSSLCSRECGSRPEPDLSYPQQLI